jgi:hypothetical protein
VAAILQLRVPQADDEDPIQSRKPLTSKTRRSVLPDLPDELRDKLRALQLLVKWLQIFRTIDEADQHRNDAVAVREEEEFVEEAEGGLEVVRATCEAEIDDRREHVGEVRRTVFTKCGRAPFHVSASVGRIEKVRPLMVDYIGIKISSFGGKLLTF